MFGRLREINEELAALPDQLAPLEKQVERGREVLQQSEQTNPLRQSLVMLLRRAERVHVENLGWLVGHQSIDPATVASYVVRFLFTVLGKAPPASSGNEEEPGASGPYDLALAAFVGAENAGGLPAGALEAALVRKLFAESWLAADSKLRAHVMEELKREAGENARWLPEPKVQTLDEEGKGLVGEGAGAFGGYFSAGAVFSFGLRSYRMTPPTRSFSGLNSTFGLLIEDTVFPKVSRQFTAAATTTDRGRALMAIAYVHFVRSVLMGGHERDHRKISDALNNAEVALEAGRKRMARLRSLRSELVLQSAGFVGIIVMLVAVVLYILYSMLVGDEPPKPKA
jgi:hypothetical protein